MENPFAERYDSDDDDASLVRFSLEGDRAALEKLVLRHQAWIFNIAHKMVMDLDDASDVTQEILVKAVTRLSTYDPSRGSFRTWLYRITANHVITMKKRRMENVISSMDDYFSYINAIPDDRSFTHPEHDVLMEESKINCLTGMLLCFSRRDRLVFILGALFNTPDALGSEIAGVTRANYRKILSLCRRRLHECMNSSCGLLNDAAPCRCTNKWKVLIERGVIDPDNLRYYRENTSSVREAISVTAGEFSKFYHDRMMNLFGDQPFYDIPDMRERVKAMLDDAEFRRMLRLND